MIYNYDIFYGMPFLVPRIPIMNEKPPTLYSILNSIANFGKEEKTKIKNLALETHEKIFDFDYPLNKNINKNDFECMILNKFLMRRIGFDTMTAFKIQLNVKLNEIMPIYNQLFELIYSDNAFGEITKREGFDNRTINGSTSNKSNTTTSVINNSNNETTNENENATSDTPQNEIDNIYNKSYISEFSQNKGKVNSIDTSKQNGSSENSSTSTDKQTNDNIYKETTSKINLIDVYTKLNEDLKNVYTLIFNDLEELFYQLI